MFLPVRLMGVQLPWALVGGIALEGWLLARPWIQAGGIAGLRIAGRVSAELVTAEVRAAVRRIDEGTTDVMTEQSEFAADDNRSPVNVVCDAVGVDEGDEQSRRNRLARSLDFTPRVLVLDASARSDEEIASMMRELEELRSDLAKRNPRARLVALVLHEHASEGTWFEMDVGGPIALLLEEPSSKPQRNWSVYLHTRIAWETAGDIDRSLMWEPIIGTDISIGRDEEVEARLNHLAINELKQRSAADQQAIRQHLQRPHGASSNADDALIARRLFWRPHGSATARPVPWLARALLLAGSFPQVFELLRSALVCGPLLRAAMGRCLDLEAFARVRFRESLGSQIPDEEALERFDAFRAGRGHDVGLYPKGCPARPITGWSFAQFGSYVAALTGVPQTERDALHELRILRNALAHGHYVPWSALEKLRNLESTIRSRD